MTCNLADLVVNIFTKSKERPIFSRERATKARPIIAVKIQQMIVGQYQSA